MSQLIKDSWQSRRELEVIHGCVQAAMMTLQKTPTNEEYFRRALDHVRGCQRHLGEKDPPSGALHDLQRLYALGLDTLIGTYAEKLCAKTRPLASADLYQEEELSASISEIAEKATAEVRLVEFKLAYSANRRSSLRVAVRHRS
jgi:hypothetical protein